MAGIVGILGVIGSVVSVVSGVAGLFQSANVPDYSAYYENMANSQRMAAEAQAKTMESNAKLAEMESANLITASKQEQEQLSKQRRKAIGEQAAMYSAAGVSLVGSPLDVMAETASEYERDILNASWSGEQKSRAKLYEASLNRWQAQQTRIAGQYQAYGTSLLGQAKQEEAEAASWNQMTSAGSSLMGGVENLSSSISKLAKSW